MRAKYLHCALVATLVLANVPKSASAESCDPSFTTALFPLERAGRSHAALIRDFENELRKAVRRTGLTLVTGPGLMERLRRAPQLVLTQCRKRPRCYTQLMRRLNVDQLIYGRVRVGNNGQLRVALHEVTTGTATKPMSIDVVMSRQRDIAQAVQRVATELLRCPGAKMPADEMEDDAIALVPLTPLESPTTTKEPPPETEPDKENIPPSEEEPTLELAALSPVSPSGDIRVKEHEASDGLNMLQRLGWGTVGVGGVAAAGGLFFGIQSEIIYARDKGVGTTPMPQAYEIRRDYRTALRRANLFYLIGGIFAATGASLLALDHWYFRGAEPRLEVAPGAGGASISVTAGW